MGQTEGTSTRHSRKNLSFFFWIQLAVDLVNMSQVVVRSGKSYIYAASAQI